MDNIKTGETNESIQEGIIEMNSTNELQSRLTIDAKQAAKFIGISYWKVCEMCKKGLIPFISIGRKRLFRQDALLRWADQQEAANVKNTTATIW